jgi:tetratricopeptide (TPR) repeat protein
MGAVHFFQGRTDLANESITQAVRLAPGDLAGGMWQVVHGRFLGNSGEAIAAARRVIETEPLFWPPRYHLGELLREEGKTAEAVSEQEKVLEQDPGNVLALRCLARAHLDAGDLQQARQVLEGVRPQDRGNFRVRMVWAQIHALEGRREAAIQEMDDEVLKFADLQPFAALDAAEVYAILGQQDRAIEWVDRSMRKGDGRVDWLRRDPLLAGVREHPRFKQIVSSMEFRRQQGPASPAQPPR